MPVINAMIPRSQQGTVAALEAATGLPATVYVKKLGAPDTLILGMQAICAYKLGSVFFLQPGPEGALMEGRGKTNLACLQNGSAQLAIRIERVVRCGCDEERAIIVLSHDAPARLHKVVKAHRVNLATQQKKNLGVFKTYDENFRRLHSLPPLNPTSEQGDLMPSSTQPAPRAVDVLKDPPPPTVNDEVRGRTPDQYRELFDTFAGSPVVIYKLRIGKTPLLGLTAKAVCRLEDYLLVNQVTQHGFYTNVTSTAQQVALEEGNQVVMLKLRDLNRAGVVNGVVELYLKCEAAPDINIKMSRESFQERVARRKAGPAPETVTPAAPAPVPEPPAEAPEPPPPERPPKPNTWSKASLWITANHMKTVKMQFKGNPQAVQTLVINRVTCVELYVTEGPLAGKFTVMDPTDCWRFYDQTTSPLVAPEQIPTVFRSRAGTECLQLLYRDRRVGPEMVVNILSIGIDGALSSGYITGMLTTPKVVDPDIVMVRLTPDRVAAFRTSDIVLTVDGSLVVKPTTTFFNPPETARTITSDEVRTRLSVMSGIRVHRFDGALPGSGTVVAMGPDQFAVMYAEQGKPIHLAIPYDAVASMDNAASSVVHLCDRTPVTMTQGLVWNPLSPTIHAPTSPICNHSKIYRQTPDGTARLLGTGEYVGVTQGMAVVQSFTSAVLQTSGSRTIGIKFRDIVWSSEPCPRGGDFLIRAQAEFVDLKRQPGVDDLDVAPITLSDVMKTCLKPIDVSPPVVPPQPEMNIVEEGLAFWTKLTTLAQQLERSDKAIAEERLRLQKEQDLHELSVTQLNLVRKNQVDVWQALAAVGQQRALPICGSGPELPEDHPLVLRHKRLIVEDNVLLEAVSPDVFAEASKHYMAQFASAQPQPPVQPDPASNTQPHRGPGTTMAYRW